MTAGQHTGNQLLAGVSHQRSATGSRPAPRRSCNGLDPDSSVGGDSAWDWGAGTAVLVTTGCVDCVKPALIVCKESARGPPRDTGAARRPRKNHERTTAAALPVTGWRAAGRWSA